MSWDGSIQRTDVRRSPIRPSRLAALGVIEREEEGQTGVKALTNMKSRHWEKLWHDIIDDIDLGPLPGELKWRFVQLIVMAGIQGEGGLLPDLPDMAFRLRLTEEQLRSDLPTLAKRELVELVSTRDGRERWFVTNYAKRQSPMTATERSQKHRSISAAAAKDIYQEEEEDRAEAEADKCNGSLHFRCNNVTADLLAEAGIGRNRTTAPLWELEPDYVAAHLAAPESPGLIIRRMLDGDPPPARRKERTLENQIPDQYAHLVTR